jgi:hypothetical protein
MKTIILLASCLALAGCAGQPKHQCVALDFPRVPSPELTHQLAATQSNTTDAEVAKWFDSGELNFVLSSVHTNEIAMARAEGATVKVIHSSSGIVMPIYGKK